MEMFFKLCSGLTAGVIIGILCGGIKIKLTRKSYTEKQVESNKKWIRRIAGVLKYVTFAALSVGLIWCVFFLTLGIVSPQQSDYANNMAELIVAVLTVISIIFAFVEFLHRN